MKEIAFILPAGSFPVPAVNGGAVESLLELLIYENEKCNNFKFHVFMCKKTTDKTGYEYSKYKNTVFHDFYMSPTWFKLNRIFNAGNKRLGYKLPICSPFDRFLIKNIKKLNPDFVVFEGSYTIAARHISRFLGREKMIYHVHHQVFPKRDVSLFFSRMICVSNFIKNDWEQNFKFKKQIDLIVLPNAIDTKHFSKKMTQKQTFDLRTKLGFKQDDFIVLYVGRLIQPKGVDKLINAVKDLNKEDVKLLILGESAFKNSIKTKYDEYLKSLCVGYDDKIKFTGFIDNSEVYKYYSIANVHALASLCEEAAGLVLLESKCVGTPQILTNSGGAPEFAKSDAIIVKKEENLEDNLCRAILSFYEKRKILVHKPERVYDAEYYYNMFRCLLEEANK